AELEGARRGPELPAARPEQPPALPREFEEAYRLLQELLGLDLVNMTPLQALLVLNEFQTRWRQLLSLRGEPR
ncbi:hypothetical protein, partial [Thermoflexus sp.]